jgi:hypothetical protein
MTTIEFFAGAILEADHGRQLHRTVNASVRLPIFCSTDSFAESA